MPVKIPPSPTTCTIAFEDISSRAPLNLHRLPASLIHYANTLTAQRGYQYLACRILLAELIYAKLNIATLPEMKIGENARPTFTHQQLPDFNISHSGEQIAVALISQGSVGIDIEVNRLRKSWRTLAQHSFSTQECLWLDSLAESERIAGFWRLWTTRESILKLAGKGVWQMKYITLDPENNQATAEFISPLSLWQQQINNCFIAVSSNHNLDKVEIFNTTTQLFLTQQDQPKSN